MLVSCSKDKASALLTLEKPYDKLLAYGSLKISKTSSPLTIEANISNLKSTTNYSLLISSNGSCDNIQASKLQVAYEFKMAQSSISGALFAFNTLPQDQFKTYEQLVGKQLLVLNPLIQSQDNTGGGVEVCFEFPSQS